MATLDNVTVITSLVNSSVTTIAVVTGGFWAYFKFAKGRTFSLRGDIEVSGSWHIIEGKNVLRVIIKLTNLGSSKITYRPISTNFQISKLAFREDGPRRGPITWKKIAGPYPLFFWKESDQWTEQWIEPGEALSDDLLIDLDVSEPLPLLLDVQVILLHGRRRRVASEFTSRHILLENSVIET